MDIKAKMFHISSTGREPFVEKLEVERAIDVVGRDNPKYFKPDFTMSPTSMSFMEQLTSTENEEIVTQNTSMMKPASGQFHVVTVVRFLRVFHFFTCIKSVHQALNYWFH